MIKRIIGVALLLGLAGVFAGCETMEGAGRDVERGGEVIQEKSQETQDRL